MKVHHILIGSAAHINSNIVRYYCAHCEEMGTTKEDHVFHYFQDRAALKPDESRFFEGLPVAEGRFTFIRPTTAHVLKVLLQVDRRDVILIHSGRMHGVLVALCVTPWLWRRTALIGFGGETPIWQRINASKGWKNRIVKLCQRIVLPRIGAICTLTPGEYRPIRELFPGADNYQRVFMSATPSTVSGPLDTRARSRPGTVHVLLNQSANVGGRHREALGWLSRFKGEAVRVICPVSFGEEGEVEEVVRAGRELLGDKCAFIREKLPYDAYSRMVKEEMDILVLNHLGQAGLGHLYMFLSTGKPVYIRRQTPLYAYLEELGVEVRATDSIPEMSFQDFSLPLTCESAMKNVTLFNDNLSTEASVASCKRLVGFLRNIHE